jgi:mycothiol system anti-sigma-R factor
VSHDEHSNEEPESNCGPSDSRYDELKCAAVIAEVWTFLDGECTPETHQRLCKHLKACSSCRSYYQLEARIKCLIATKCGGDKAPKRLGGRGCE